MNMKQKPIFGVIGGAGVAATNKLCELVEQSITRGGATRDAHHPQMIIYQATQAPSRSMYLEGRGPSFIGDYIQVGLKLREAGATVLCMSCNTAHYAIDQIEGEVGIPFINMIREVVLKVRGTGYHRIGLIASDGCLQGRVYEKYFESLYPSARLIYPDPQHQSMVTRGICNIKNSSRFLPTSDPERPRRIFSLVTENLLDLGAEIVVVGCTDIRVDFTADLTVDSLEVLAESIIGFM